jgi:hypothetical protein
MKYFESGAFINLRLTKLWVVRGRSGRNIGLGGVKQERYCPPTKKMRGNHRGLSACTMEAANIDIVFGKFLLLLFTH